MAHGVGTRRRPALGQQPRSLLARAPQLGELGLLGLDLEAAPFGHVQLWNMGEWCDGGP